MLRNQLKNKAISHNIIELLHNKEREKYLKTSITSKMKFKKTKLS